VEQASRLPSSARRQRFWAGHDQLQASRPPGTPVLAFGLARVQSRATQHQPTAIRAGEHGRTLRAG